MMGKARGGLVFLLVVLLIQGRARGAAASPSAFFCFGDSYADTGNQIHSSSSWKYPDGITWPGYPTGRFGNGHIQTDFLADKLGLPVPTPYVNLLNGGIWSIAPGVNFAIGGSGVTFALGVLPIGAQVNQFELVLRTGAYSPEFLADSVTLVSNVGNDYNVKAYSNLEYLVVVQQVVSGMTQSLERLYDLGLRNILVANLPPINCFPGTTVVSNYSTCETIILALVEFHNTRLSDSVDKLNKLPGANFLILNELAAFNYVLNNPDRYGIEETLLPCCRPLTAADNCGDVDLLGKQRYTLCDDPSLHVYWDTVHPVESTWNHVVDLFYNESGFCPAGTTLEEWLYQNTLRPPAVSAPAPTTGQAAPTGGAIGQLDAAHQALISNPDYAESLGLLQALDLDELLAGVPSQAVTVFLPNNLAYYTTPSATILRVYAVNQVLPVAEFHVVEGYFDSTMLSGSFLNLTTFSGSNLIISSLANQTLVGPTNCMVVAPDLYTVDGQVAVHGISGLLLPPGLQQ